ncbi:PLP-dependent transferase [Viridothelium virens]|uniref:PLP-dependent transferase n=1 Tax=Viridothelium virens TaxID=1048519 RepID=A0A6A6HDQ1_VIRVR|nr:PLP-dependent transferase [Viridothelium virens]
MANHISKGRLSDRGRDNVDSVIPRIPKTILEAGSTPDEDGIIDMSVAENWLIRDEILEIEREVVESKLHPEHLSWPRGFHGNAELLEALAAFINSYFDPNTCVQPNQIAIAPGAAGCVDALLYNLCNPGDGVLLPAPYWNGYDTVCRLRASNVPILVPISDLSDEASFLSALQTTYEESNRPIKILMLANPHNPLGRCFSREALETCLRFCQEKDIHFVSDEVFGPLTFDTPSFPQARQFVSVLAIDPVAIGCDQSRVHVIWSPSKVLALSGLRLGCTITQSNPDLRNALTLASFTNVSILSTLLTTQVLRTPKLNSILDTTATRFTDSYRVVTSFFERLKVSYLPCNSGPFILVNIVPHAESWEDEAATIVKLKEAGVWVSAGRSHHMPENAKGWARITFALPPRVVEEGLKRIEKVLKA